MKRIVRFLRMVPQDFRAARALRADYGGVFLFALREYLRQSWFASQFGR